MEHPKDFAKGLSIGIIMDGNGRWAKSRGLPRTAGHKKGAQVFQDIANYCDELGVESVYFYAFSTENWKRPADEVNALMKFFVMGLREQAKLLLETDIRLHVVGDVTAFPEELQRTIRETEATTAHCSAMTLNICANYGGSWDITDAVNRLIAAGKPVTTETINDALNLSWAGPVDLMIRTGGEQRISNFILWQAAYAELWFTEVLWPDFDAKDLEEAVAWFGGRERRFGKTGDQVKNGG
mgnify:CR=1 FL=1